MSKPIRKNASLFSHEQDEAFQLVLALDTMLQRAVAVRGVAAERAAMRQLMARIAHCVGDAELLANATDAREPYERALEASRVVFLSLQCRDLGPSLSTAQYLEARTLVQRLRVILKHRVALAGGRAGESDGEEATPPPRDQLH